MRSSLTVVLILNFRDSIRHPTQCVQHGKFGEGVVLQAEGHGERARVQVNFARDGSKWLMLGYAKLQPLD